MLQRHTDRQVIEGTRSKLKLSKYLGGAFLISSVAIASAAAWVLIPGHRLNQELVQGDPFAETAFYLGWRLGLLVARVSALCSCLFVGGLLMLLRLRKDRLLVRLFDELNSTGTHP